MSNAIGTIHDYLCTIIGHNFTGVPFTLKLSDQGTQNAMYIESVLAVNGDLKKKLPSTGFSESLVHGYITELIEAVDFLH